MDRLIQLQKESKKNQYERFKDLSTDKLGEFKLLTGKYSGNLFREMIDTHPEYCNWVIKNIKSRASPTFLFKHYLEKKLEEELALEKLQITEDEEPPLDEIQYKE